MFQLFLNQLPRRMLLPYRNSLWVWHVVAALTTAALVFAGLDWWFFQITRGEYLFGLIMIAGIGGFFVPICLPVILYIIGKRRKSEQHIRTAVGVAQASIIAWIIIAVYKVFTGRIQPESLVTPDTYDTSLSSFQFGFFEHGIFWGWPSHHTAVAVAGATVLFLAWRRPQARFGALVWAVIVGAGAAAGFHWLSDVVAGAIVGVVVGIAVWRDLNT